MNEYNELIKKMKKKGIKFEEGLKNEELLEIERMYKLIIPEEYKEFLSLALPISAGFYNWRDMSEENINHIKNAIVEPLEGLVFDVLNNQFWLDKYGERPDDNNLAIQILKENYENAPKLVPIYKHRYIVALEEKKIQIISVMQSDIIYYGQNINEYFKYEFELAGKSEISYNYNNYIPFWSDIIDD